MKKNSPFGRQLFSSILCIWFRMGEAALGSTPYWSRRMLELFSWVTPSAPPSVTCKISVSHANSLLAPLKSSCPSQYCFSSVIFFTLFSATSGSSSCQNWHFSSWSARATKGWDLISGQVTCLRSQCKCSGKHSWRVNKLAKPHVRACKARCNLCWFSSLFFLVLQEKTRQILCVLQKIFASPRILQQISMGPCILPPWAEVEANVLAQRIQKGAILQPTTSPSTPA